jgi:hypothetical protein
VRRAQELVEREREAITYRSYESGLIPGLLRTAGYMRSLIESRVPPLDEETVEERITGRSERQVMLTERKPPVACAFTVYEAALRVPHGFGTSSCRCCPFEHAPFSAGMGPMITPRLRPGVVGVHRRSSARSSSLGIRALPLVFWSG